MTSLHPEAQHLLDRYLLQVRAALAGCRSIDPSEVERDILDHVEAEFPGRAEPVSRGELEPVLRRLGSPDDWVTAEQAPWWRRAARRLRCGPEDWRLAYLAFGLLLAGLILPPLLPVCLLAGYCAARAALAVARSHGEDLGPQKWLIHPVLLVSSAALAALTLLWPGPLAGAAGSYLRYHHPEAMHLLLPRAQGLAEWELVGHSSAAAIGLWCLLLGVALRRRPEVARALLRPFADWFAPRHACLLGICGLALAIGSGAALLFGLSFYPASGS
jgi:hypothetical protein